MNISEIEIRDKNENGESDNNHNRKNDTKENINDVDEGNEEEEDNEDNVRALTYEEIRQRNIARNEEFLNYLFPQGMIQSERQKNGLEKKKNSHINQSHLNQMNIHELCNYLQQKLPARPTEVMRILEYLQQNFTRSPALLIYGPAGVGKSHVCLTCLAEIKSFPLVHLSCSRLTSVRKFWNDIWSSLIHSLRNFNVVNFSHSPPFSNEKVKKSITSFSLLITKIHILLKKQEKFLFSLSNNNNNNNNHSDNSSSSGKNNNMANRISGVIMVFDDIYAADTLEEGFTQRLLSIGKNSSTNIKVIGIQRSPPDRCLGHIHLPFTPYSTSQLLLIIESRLENYKPPLPPPLPAPSPHSTASSGPIMTESQKNQFLSLARESIHFIIFRTHDINEIWAILTSLWEKYYVSSSSNEIKLSTKFLETEIGSILRQPTIHITDSVGNSQQLQSLQRKDSINLKRNLSILSTDSSDSSHSLFRTSSIQPSSVVNMTTLLGSSWFNDMPLLEKSILLAAYLASNNPQETDVTTFGTALKGRRKRLRAGQDPDQINTNNSSSNNHNNNGSMQTKEQINSPRTFGLERLLAIYIQILPSTSFSVLSTLWWHPSAAAIQFNPANENKNEEVEIKKRLLLNNPTIFEIEQKLRYYGYSETHVYSVINSLVSKQHLLIHSPHSSSSTSHSSSSSSSSTKNHYYDSTSPMIYYCTLNLEQAEELARSISFPLRDYLCT